MQTLRYDMLQDMSARGLFVVCSYGVGIAKASGCGTDDSLTPTLFLYLHLKREL